MKGKQYKWNASDYECHSGAQLEWARDLIEKLDLRGHESVLDIGCGDGKVTAAIAARLPEGRVVGIDNSTEMIELARERHAGANLHFEYLDVRNLAWTERFDVVFSNAVMHWIKRHLPVLRRVHHAMQTDGRLLFQMGGHGNARDIVAVIDELMRDKWSRYFEEFTFPYGFYTVEAYTRWLDAAGFGSHRIELIPKDMQHRDREALAGWIRTTWLPYLEKIPAARREEFIDAVVEEYTVRHPADASGIIHVAMVRLEVAAVKTNAS